jgi:hypothetical protein
MHNKRTTAIHCPGCGHYVMKRPPLARTIAVLPWVVVTYCAALILYIVVSYA